MSNIDIIREDLEKKLHNVYENPEGNFTEYIGEFIRQFYTGITNTYWENLSIMYYLINSDEIKKFLLNNSDDLKILEAVKNRSGDF